VTGNFFSHASVCLCLLFLRLCLCVTFSTLTNLHSLNKQLQKQRRRFRLEKLIISYLVKNFPSLYSTPNFIKNLKSPSLADVLNKIDVSTSYSLKIQFNNIYDHNYSPFIPPIFQNPFPIPNPYTFPKISLIPRLCEVFLNAVNA